MRTHSVYIPAAAGALTVRRVADLIELRKLRRARQGIDASKLTEGDGKRKKRRKIEDDDSHIDQGGLRKSAPAAPVDDDEDECVSPVISVSHFQSNVFRMDDKDTKARLAVRKSNFTQQTNTLDVDKHMFVLPTAHCYSYLRSSQDGIH